MRNLAGINSDSGLECCLEEAKRIGTRARLLYFAGSVEEALQLKLSEVKLLEDAYQSTLQTDKKNGQIAGYLGESYSSLAKLLYKAGRNDLEYLQKSRAIFKVTFDDGRLPAFAYDTYLFVLRKLLAKAVTAEEKLPYARDYVSVLMKAAKEERNINYKGGNQPASELLLFAIKRVSELEEQIKGIKGV